MSHYDKVLKCNNEGVILQALLDNQQAKKDCDDLRRCLEKFGINDPHDVYDLSEDPTKEQTIQVFRDIMFRLTEGRDSPVKVNYLVFFIFAGHGVLQDGQHSMLFTVLTQCDFCPVL